MVGGNHMENLYEGWHQPFLVRVNRVGNKQCGHKIPVSQLRRGRVGTRELGPKNVQPYLYSSTGLSYTVSTYIYTMHIYREQL